MKTTLDGILGQRVQLEQPEEGFRVAVDTVLLAASIPARGGQRVLDIGCGVGGVMLCLAARIPGLTGVGVEVQGELADIATRNFTRNNQPGFSAIMADAGALPEIGMFDHAFINPPYHDERQHDVSPNRIKQRANAGMIGDLAIWIAEVTAHIKDGGTLSIIHRADCLGAVLAAMPPQSYAIHRVVYIHPRDGVAAKRVIVQSVRSAGAGEAVRQMCQPLILHSDGQGYTFDAEDILRHATALDFVE